MQLKITRSFFLNCLLATFLAVCLLKGAQAITDVTPAKSVISPTTGKLYAVNNAAHTVKEYTYSSSSWSSSKTIYLPSKASCYGLAVSPTGDNLYISVNYGATSEVRVYPLPLTSTFGGFKIYYRYSSMTGATWSSASSPANLALGGGNRLFLVDKGSGRFRVYDTATNAYIKQVTTGGISGLSNLYDIVVTSTNETTYKIYISHKTESGSVFIYDYDTTSDTATYVGALSGLTYPTFLKIYDDQLFVSVNGYDGIDMYVYDTSSDSLVGTVANASGITGSYGWTAFDTADSGYLIYKKAACSTEAINWLYKIEIASIESGSTASRLSASGIIKSDSLVVAYDKNAIALTDSDTGSLEVLDNSSSRYFDNNTAACSPESLAQYALNGTTLLSSLEPSNYINYGYGLTYAAYDSSYPTFTSRIMLKFRAVDVDGDTISRVKIYYKQPTGTTWSTSTYYTGSFTSGSGTISLTFPQSGFLPRSGAWEWGAATYDGHEWSSIVYYNNNTNAADFYLDTTLPSPTFNTPYDLQTDVSTTQEISISFSETMEVDSFSLRCTNEAGTDYSGFADPVWNAAYTSVTLTHESGSRFSVNTTYRLLVEAEDVAGNKVSYWDSYIYGASPDKRAIQFTTRGVNNTPEAFNLTSPISGQITTEYPTFSWEESSDPDGDAVTYIAIITNEAGTRTYWSVTTATSVTRPSALPGGDYYWTVRAEDAEGAAAYASNAPQTFTVVADDGLSPTVESVIPTDESTEMATNQTVVITFSEPMTTATISSSPSVTWYAPTWSDSAKGPQTVATFTHDSFATGTTYEITISGQDYYGNALDTTASTALGSNGTLDLTTLTTSTTGSRTFTISYASSGAENWISIPYEAAEGSGGYSLTDTDQLVASLATIFMPEEYDQISIYSYDNVLQTYIGPVQYIYEAGIWDAGGFKMDLEVGYMYSISLDNLTGSRSAFSSTWTVSGNIPLTVSLPFSYQSPSLAQNWISIPTSSSALTDTDQLVASLATKFTPEDYDQLTIYGYDNALKTYSGPVQYIYEAGIWDSGGFRLTLNPGDPLVVNIDNLLGSRSTTFSVTWPD